MVQPIASPQPSFAMQNTCIVQRITPLWLSSARQGTLREEQQVALSHTMVQPIASLQPSSAMRITLFTHPTALHVDCAAVSLLQVTISANSSSLPHWDSPALLQDGKREHQQPTRAPGVSTRTRQCQQPPCQHTACLTALPCVTWQQLGSHPCCPVRQQGTRPPLRAGNPAAAGYAVLDIVPHPSQPGPVMSRQACWVEYGSCPNHLV
jgi:hypothetical protein